MRYIFHVILLHILMNYHNHAFSQSTPIFQMPLFFEDAVGNKDTLIVGYDTSKVTYYYNNKFDGPPLNSPLDSIFEVRAFHFEDNVLTESSKKIITHLDLWDTSVEDCGVTAYFKMVVSCKYPPIKISYDSTLLNPGSCQSNTIISPDWLLFFIQFWWKADLYYCLGNSSSITDSLNFQGQKFEVNAEVEGKGMKTLPGLFMVFRDWGPCTDPSLLAAKSASTLSIPLSVSPNPVHQCAELKFTAEHTGIYRLDILDLSGTALQTQTIPVGPGTNTQDLDLALFPSGAYVVRITDGKKIGSTQLIKQ